jgi:hypothetical protein
MQIYIETSRPPLRIPFGCQFFSREEKHRDTHLSTVWFKDGPNAFFSWWYRVPKPAENRCDVA